jgi:hypothetical protein
LATAHKSSFLPMRIAAIAAPIRFANVGNWGLGVVMFYFERSNQRILGLDGQNFWPFSLPKADNILSHDATFPLAGNFPNDFQTEIINQRNPELLLR